MASDLAEFISREGLNQFFLDVRENLDLMESSLLEMEDFPEAIEPRQSFLRAVHSIKGAAHMFGYEEVARFSHLLEDVHIPVQKGEMAPDDRLISQTLKARDLLDQLLDGKADPGLQEGLYGYFAGLRPHRAAPPPATEPPERSRPDRPVDYHVRFRFHPDKPIFGTATNPLWYLRALNDIGDMWVQCQVDAVPPLERIDPEACYLYWDCQLTTIRARAEIVDEFVFIEDDLAELVVEENVATTGEGRVCQRALALQEKPPAAKADRPPKVPTNLVEERFLKILIADDEFNNRLLLRGMLQSLGDCDMVVDGGEAVEIFEMALADGKPYDLILLDIMMPVLDGYAALHRMREIEHQHGVKPREETIVIMVTALDTPRSIFRAYYKSGCTDYIVKPVTRETLEGKLMQHGLMLHV